MKRLLCIFALMFVTGVLHAQDGSFLDSLATAFDKLSLVGCPAQPLSLVDMDGAAVELRPGESGRFTVLYFYDTDCGKCLVESAMVCSILGNGDYPVDFYTVNVGSDEAGWRKYVAEHLDVHEGNVRTVHLWDPERTFDYQLKYGVIGTPRLFLVNPEGIIIGRRMPSPVLDEMLSWIFREKKLDYGTKDGNDLYDAVFGVYEEDGGKVRAGDVLAVAEHIAARNLVELRDTVLYRQMTGDLLYYITNRKEEGFRMAAAPFVRSQISARGDVWKTADDSLKVVCLADMLAGLTSRLEPGSRVPDVRLDGDVRRVRGGSIVVRDGVTRRLRGLCGRENVVFFHQDGCSDCHREMDGVSDYLLSHRGCVIFLVNMTAAVEKDSSLLDIFDLSATPYIISYDRKGRVTRKYFSLL